MKKTFPTFVQKLDVCIYITNQTTKKLKEKLTDERRGKKNQKPRKRLLRKSRIT